MLALILRAAGWHPSFLIGGDLNEVGTNAACGRRRLARRRSRRERRHVPRALAGSGVGHERRTRPSRPLRRLRRSRAGVRTLRRRRFRPDRLLRGRPGGQASPRRASERAPTGSPRAPTTGSSTRSSTRVVAGSPRTAGSDSDRRSAGVKASTNAAGAVAIALELGVDVDAAVTRARRLRRCARRFQFRGELDGVTFVDDYAHLPERGRRRDRDRARGSGAGSSWCSNRTATRGRRRSGLDFADAFVGADPVVLTDVYAAGETPIPGVSGRRDPARRARPSSRVAGRLPPRPGDPGSVPMRYALRPATSC